MRVIEYSEAQDNLKAVLDEVAEEKDITIIKRRNSKDVAVMSLSTFNGMMETFYLFKSPSNAAHLMKSVEQYKKGGLKESALLE